MLDTLEQLFEMLSFNIKKIVFGTDKNDSFIIEITDVPNSIEDIDIKGKPEKIRTDISRSDNTLIIRLSEDNV